MNKVLLLVAALVLAGGAYYYFISAGAVPAPIPVANEKNQGAKTYVASDFSWQITPAVNYEETMPYHEVALVLDGEIHPIRGAEPYMGCAENNTRPRLPDELSTVVCWWAGGGHELGLFLENGEYHVKERWIQESGGPEVNADTEGEWHILVDIH